MAHLLNPTLDVVAAFDNLDTWHGVNTYKVGQPESAEDAYRRSRLTWEVRTVPHWIPGVDDHVESDPIPSAISRAIVTDDPENPGRHVELGSCGLKWHPLPNRDLFLRAHPFVENQYATYETAGSIRGRQCVWVGLRLGEDYVDDDDPVVRRLLFTNQHTGIAGFKVGLVPKRTVCDNTMQANLIRGRFMGGSHTKNVAKVFQDTAESLELINKKWSMTLAQYRKMTKIKVSQDKLEQYILKCFGGESILDFDQQEKDLLEKGYTDEQIEAAKAEYAKKLFPEIKRSIFNALDSAPGARLKGSLGTAWGAYNGVTFFLTNMRGGEGREEARLHANLFGGSAIIASRAFRLAQAL